MHSSKNNSIKNGEKPVFITQNPEMKKLYEKVKHVARSQAPVFVTGESGTGKEVIARLLHYHSSRKEKPFVALNGGAISKDIVESELFGHEKGSFTGAINSKKGCFEQAHEGILFLDEIGDMSPDIQVKLLRAAELKNFRRVGGSEEIFTDVQIISATNKNIMDLMSDGKFREDLYYRLSVIELHIPPLRDRREDISILSDFFLSKYLQDNNLPEKKFSKEFKNYLMNYHWPGNVRELRNVIERCAIMCSDDIIHTEYLPDSIENVGPMPSEKKNGHGNGSMNGSINGNGEAKHFYIPIGTSMKNAERIIINRTLNFTENNISEAARILEVSRNTLHNKLSKFNE